MNVLILQKSYLFELFPRGESTSVIEVKKKFDLDLDHLSILLGLCIREGWLLWTEGLRLIPTSKFISLFRTPGLLRIWYPQEILEEI